MALSCTSESWTCGLYLRSRIWLEDVLENSRVAVGYESLSPHYNLSSVSSGTHAASLQTSPFPSGFASYSYCRDLTSLYRRRLSVFLCPVSVLFIDLHPERRNSSLEYFPQVKNDLLFTRLLFIVMICLLSLETARSSSTVEIGWIYTSV